MMSNWLKQTKTKLENFFKETEIPLDEYQKNKVQAKKALGFDIVYGVILVLAVAILTLDQYEYGRMTERSWLMAGIFIPLSIYYAFITYNSELVKKEVSKQDYDKALSKKKKNLKINALITGVFICIMNLLFKNKPEDSSDFFSFLLYNVIAYIVIYGTILYYFTLSYFKKRLIIAQEEEDE